MSTNGGRTALFLGATGLVGSHALRLALERGLYSRVVALVRRPPTVPLREGLEARVVDFADLDAVGPLACDDIICALGTTRRKAGSPAEFTRIDHDLPLELLRRAHLQGARRLALVSAAGANSTSPNLYMRTKGALERDVAGLGFEAVHIFRPGLLVGERTERRTAEAAGILVARVMRSAMQGPLRRYRPIGADQVAAAMLAAVRRADGGIRIYYYDEMLALSSEG